jgi:hypothetical protein
MKGCSSIQLLTLVAFLGACSADQPEKPSVAEEIAQYGTDFQRNHPNEGLQFRRVDDTSGGVMATYIVYYTSSQPKYQLEEVISDGDAAYNANSKKIEDWEQFFCTPELRQLMVKHGVNFVMGQVLAPGMRDNDPSKLIAQCGR